MIGLVPGGESTFILNYVFYGLCELHKVADEKGGHIKPNLINKINKTMKSTGEFIIQYLTLWRLPCL